MILVKSGTRVMMVVAVILGAFALPGCGASEEKGFAGQPKPDINRDNGTPPPRGIRAQGN